MASFENALPVEQWLQVLEMIPTKDLCNVMLTSEHMNSIASSQDLWAKTKVNKEMAMRNGLTPLFIIDRFKKIKEIDFSRMGVWITSQMLENLLNDIQESSLEKVDFHVTNLSGAPAEPLAKAVSHLKAVVLRSTSLTTLQSTKVLETSLSSYSLRELDLAFVILSGVPANLLASAVCRLKTVNLGYTRLTTQQSATLVEACSASTTLVDVDLTQGDLSGVPAELLARAVGRLQRVKLGGTRLTAQQSATLVEACIVSTTLENVGMAWVKLSGVPADLLARAVGRLQRVNLAYTGLTTQQATAVVEASILSTTLVDVDLEGVTLSGVPAELLGRLVGRLQSVDLFGTKMTRDQGIAVGQAVLASTSLRQADLRANQMQENLPAQLFEFDGERRNLIRRNNI